MNLEHVKSFSILLGNHQRVEKVEFAEPSDYAFIVTYCRHYRARIGSWWHSRSVAEAIQFEHNRAIVVLKDTFGISAFIILQRWGKKGIYKGCCKSLVTISVVEGKASILQDILPLGTIGYVSERNIKQNKVMEKTGYKKVGFTLYNNKGMHIWKKKRVHNNYLKSAQKSLTSSLASMDL